MRKRLRIFLAGVEVKSSLFHFYVAAKVAKKPLLEKTDHWKLNSFSNMVAKIDVNDLKIKEKVKNNQLHLKI